MTSTPTSPPRTARLFKNGRSQAVRIPKEFEMAGDEVLIRKDGERLILEPVRPARTLAEVIEWLQQQPPLDEDFPDIDELPHSPVEL
ncbi:antitoxin [Prosthecomicrobium pneumaticum]|nr:AbrB/MazE/SpoVT family DNA-binding domain-containing protein [Prosthecomicrobium pneumaticum]